MSHLTKMPTSVRASARTRFLNIGFDNLNFGEVLRQISRVTASQPYRYLVTPNVDHVIRSDRAAHPADAKLQMIYEKADWCLCDSRVLAKLARLRGVRLSVVPGSDLTWRLFSEVLEPGDRIAIIGGTEAAVRHLEAQHEMIEFLHHSPPMGLRDNPRARANAVSFAVEAGARFTLLAVGSPQQELLAQEIAETAKGRGVALCIGASIDFLTGTQRRAPYLLQKAGLEWAYRLASNPARFWRRYLVEGPRVLPMVVRWQRDEHAP